MPAGRPPKSDKEKQLKGTYRPSRSTGKAVHPAPKSTKAKTSAPIKQPDNLSKEARAMFDCAVNIMRTYETYTDYDEHLITIMCSEYDTYISLQDQPKIEYNENTGLTSVHASVRIRKMALDNFMKIANALSLTATMRMRIRIPDDGKDPLDKTAQFF